MPERPRSAAYTPFFCEENIWLLARRLLAEDMPKQRMFVLFLSNPNRSILLLEQRQAPKGRLTFWDYHVVLQVGQDGKDWIYDYDSRLPFPTPLMTYLTRTFPDQYRLPRIFRTMIRRIPAAEYLEQFSSDRSHMAGKIPPDAYPDYPVIQAQVSCHPITLDDYLEMRKPLPDHSRVFKLTDYPLGSGEQD
jgi:protein N-terminal glutamine amidohydrolase